MTDKFVFSSESVGEGHPDKVADYISDSILDACLEQDPHSRVACETLVKSNCVTIAGEITTSAKFDYEKVVRNAIRDIGYTNDDDVFHADKVFINNQITSQSSDISQGVNDSIAEGKKKQNKAQEIRVSSLVMPVMIHLKKCQLRSFSLISSIEQWLKCVVQRKAAGCVRTVSPK